MRNLFILFLISFLYIHQIHAQCPTANREGIHVVQWGETLYRISAKYKITVDEICAWNDIKKDDLLPTCKELAVKAPSLSGTENNDSDTAEETTGTERDSVVSQLIKQSGGKHTVQPGETIEMIAQAYGYTAERFRAFNYLRPGQEVGPGSILLSTDCDCPRKKGLEDSKLVTEATIFLPEPSPPEKDTIMPTVNEEPPARQPEIVPDSFQHPDEELATQKYRVPKKPKTRPGKEVPKKVRAYYMTTEELAMVDEINLLRSNPPGYVKYIEDYIAELEKSGSFAHAIPTARELIEELKKTPPLSVLEPAECIYRAAKKHGEDEKQRDRIGHSGSDGSWPWDRVTRECPQMSDGNENLIGGHSDNRRSVIFLLVDHGISTRGHRKTLLKKEWEYVACYKVGQIGRMPNCWVQKFGY